MFGESLRSLAGLAVITWVPGWLVAYGCGFGARRLWPSWPLFALLPLMLWAGLETVGLPRPVAFVLPLVALALAGRLRRKKADPINTSPHDPDRMFWPWVIGFAWCLLVAPVLIAFSPTHLNHELWLDGHQRFGLVRALMQGLPAENWFLSGRPLRYYYFFAYPLALLSEFTRGDVFLAWRALLIQHALAAPPAIYLLLREVRLPRRAALASVLLAFLCCSYEGWLFRIPSLSAHTGSLLDYLLHYRPDHQTGVVMTFSEQTLWEGFVFAPQNWFGPALALMLLVGVVRGRMLLAALAAGALVGTNTFVALPALAGAACVLLLSENPRLEKLKGLVALATPTLISAALCGLARPWAYVVGLGLLLVCLLPGPSQPIQFSASSLRHTRTALQMLGFAALLLFLLVNWRNPLKYALAFGPAFLLALTHPWVTRRTDEHAAARVFIAGTWLVHFPLTLLLMTGRREYFGIGPLPWLGPLYDAIHSFNFYEKSGLFVRITFAMIAGPVLAMWWRGARHSRAVRIALGSAMALACITPLLTPPAYFDHQSAVDAGLVATYQAAARPGDILLTQAFRTNTFHMAGPSRLWYFSQWSEKPYLSKPGWATWATQYCFTTDFAECTRRERAIEQFFATGTTTTWRIQLLRREGISLIHACEPLELPGTHLLAHDAAGGWLYRFDPAS